MKSKLSKSDRKTLRIARIERQIVIEQSQQIDFEYVRVRATPKKICFGSAMIRECLPTNGPSKASIMRRVMPESRSYPGPGDHYVASKLFKEYASKLGYGGLGQKTVRLGADLSRNPPVGQYNIHKEKIVKEHRKPFGVGAKCEQKSKSNTPGPGSYYFLRRKLNVNMCFGSCKKILPTVKMICTATNLAKCTLCEKTPVGDYWQNSEDSKILCRPCMLNEIQFAKSNIKPKSAKLKRLEILRSYSRVRHCGFYHDHRSAVASIRMLPLKDVKKKIRIENYLSMFGH